jgi:hypothetical protein
VFYFCAGSYVHRFGVIKCCLQYANYIIVCYFTLYYLYYTRPIVVYAFTLLGYLSACHIVLSVLCDCFYFHIFICGVFMSAG